MFKKFKKKNQSKTNSRSNDCKIHFKKRSYTPRNVQKQQTSKKKIAGGIKLKPPKNTKKENPRFEKVKRIKRREKIVAVLLIFIILAFVFLMILSTLRFVTDMRGGTTSADLQQEKLYVEGFVSIPTYPRSEFVYADKLSDSMVQQMLSQGISVYRLNTRTSHEQVYNYYMETLPSYGWEFVSTSITSTDEAMFGQYWIKDEKGLRIYLENNDIWYETLTLDEAKNMLSERRERELQRQRILELSGEQSLLPHYPWSLDVPSNYLINYPEDDNRWESVYIQKIDKENRYMIIPLGPSRERTFDEYLENFAEHYPDDDTNWEIISRQNNNLDGRRVYEFQIRMEEDLGEGILLENRLNSITYAIVTNQTDSEFYEYIINNIREPNF